MTAQREEPVQGQATVAEQAATMLRAMGFTATDKDGLVLLAAYAAESLLGYVGRLQERIADLEKELAAPPY